MCTEQDLGLALLERWRESQETVTRPLLRWWRRAEKADSRIRACHVRQHNHTAEDAFLVVDRLAVDSTRAITVSASPTGGPNLRIERGAFGVAARRRLRWWAVPAPLTLCSIRRGIVFAPVSAGAIEDDTPTLFVARDAPLNLFHSMADIVNAHLVKQMFAYERIVFLDGAEDGPFLPFWQALGAVEHFNELGGARVIERAIFAPPGGCCFLWKNAWQVRSECQRPSSLLQSFRADMLTRLGLSSPSRRRPVVTVALRKERDRSGGTVTRRIVNEHQLLATLARCDAEIRAIDFAASSCAEQVRAVLESDVLVGVHGSGLTHLLWLQPPASVVEIFPAPWQCCYENLAAWCGLGYASWTDPHPSPEGIHAPSFRVDSEAILHLVQEALSRPKLDQGATLPVRSASPRP